MEILEINITTEIKNSLEELTVGLNWQKKESANLKVDRDYTFRIANRKMNEEK